VSVRSAAFLTTCLSLALVPRTALADPPDFVSRKPRMTEGDLADKVDGRYVNGLPLLNRDPDTGLGFGARVTWFDNGHKEEDLFPYTPYRHRVYGQAFFTTNGYQLHAIDYDAPYIAGSPIRFRANLSFEKNIAANYFGLGERGLGRLRYPDAANRFPSFSDYSDALRTLRPDGTAYTRYNQYILERPNANVSLEHDFFGGIVRGLVGIRASYVSLQQWTGRSVDADDPASGEEVEARQAPTRLAEDCARSSPVRGCAGGFENVLRLGVALDTRDFEPNPNSGVFVDLVTELSGRPLGSEFDWARISFSPRVYYSPFPKLADLVIAGRLLTSVQSIGAPIFSVSDLGGLRTLRGFRQNRFQGRAVTLATLELRWTFWEVKPLRRQHFAFMLVPFFDIGRVFDTIDDFELRRFRNGQGAGIRVAWNQASVIAFDFGASREGTTFYVNFSHPF
jgi:hypothetical protein